MATAAERFATFALELELDDVPADVVDAAKLHVLDVLGCGLAAHGLGIAGEGRQAMAELGGEPESSVIGLESGLPAPNAAFAKAALGAGNPRSSPITVASVSPPSSAIAVRPSLAIPRACAARPQPSTSSTCSFAARITSSGTASSSSSSANAANRSAAVAITPSIPLRYRGSCASPPAHRASEA